MIKKAFVNSWMALKENPKLFVPDFIFRIIVIALSFYLAADFTLLANAFNSKTLAVDNFLVGELLNALTFVGIFVIFQFLLGIAVESVRYGFIADAIKKKKCFLSNFREYIKNYYFRILKLKILVGLITIVAAGLIFLIVLPLNFTAVKSYLFSIFIGVAGVVYVLMSLALFFRYPVLVLNNKTAWASILDSYKFFRKNIKYTLIAGIIISLVAGASLFGAGIPVVSIGINLLATVWISVFVFNSYHLKRKS